MVHIGLALIPNVAFGIYGQNVHMDLFTALICTMINDLAFCLTGSGSFLTLTGKVMVIGIDGGRDGIQQLGSICIGKIAAAGRAVPVRYNAFLLAGSSNGFHLYQHDVAGSGDFFKGGIVAARAGHIVLPACFGAGRSLCLMCNLVVTQSIHYFLGNDGLVTYGAVRTLGQTGFGTSGCNRIIGLFRMTQFTDDPAILFDLVLAFSVAVVVLASRAVPVGIIAALCAGCSVCLSTGHSAFMATYQNGDFGVFILLSMADRALLVLDAGIQNGCSFVHNPFPSVAQSIHHILRNDGLVTYGAVRTLGQTGFGTSGSLGCIGHGLVTQCVHHILRNDGFVTYGAVRTLGQTGFGTSGSLGCIGHGLVTQCFDQLCATNGTSLCSGAGSLCAGLVTQSGNLFLGNEYFAASRTMRAFCQTGLGTSGCLCLVGHDSMFKLRNLFGFTVAAITEISLNTRCLASSSGGSCLQHVQAFANPHSIGVGIFTVRHRRSFRIAALFRILQHSRNDRNFYIFYICSSLVYLISLSTGTRLQNDCCTLFCRRYIGARCCSIDITFGCIESTGNLDIRILQVSCCSSVGLSGSIFY